MAWILLGVVALALAVRFAKHRRTLVTVLRSESIFTIHVEMAKKQTPRRKAALDAATEVLR